MSIRFENVDILDSLKRIMQENTSFYQTDFDYDKEMLLKYAESDKSYDKSFIWFSRNHGTWCFRERDVYIKDTEAYNSLMYYANQEKDTKKLAYIVDITGFKDGMITGNLTKIDYNGFAKYVSAAAQDASLVTLFYENGEISIDPKAPKQHYIGGYNRMGGCDDPELGKFVSFEYQPEDPDLFKYLLASDKRQRDSITASNIDNHIKTLAAERISDEAFRIQNAFNDLTEANSPNCTHFMVEISQDFLNLSSSKDMDRLMNKLSYNSLSFSGIEDKRGIYVLVSEDEILAKRAKKESLDDKISKAKKNENIDKASYVKESETVR